MMSWLSQLPDSGIQWATLIAVLSWITPLERLSANIADTKSTRNVLHWEFSDLHHLQPQNNHDTSQFDSADMCASSWRRCSSVMARRRSSGISGTSICNSLCVILICVPCLVLFYVDYDWLQRTWPLSARDIRRGVDDYHAYHEEFKQFEYLTYYAPATFPFLFPHWTKYHYAQCWSKDVLSMIPVLQRREGVTNVSTVLTVYVMYAQATACQTYGDILNAS